LEINKEKVTCNL